VIILISKEIVEKIDATIKNTWINNIQKDYNSLSLLKEDSVKCSFYYHLRRKLASLLDANSLRIYPEYYIKELGYRADLAIVKVDFETEKDYLKDMIFDVVAVIEIKFASGNSERSEKWIKSYLSKIKNYVKYNSDFQLYFASIYETECDHLRWFDKRSTNNWADGHVVELSAGYINGKMKFEVHSYNHLNPKLY